LPSANQLWQANQDEKLLEYLEREKWISAGGSVRRGTRGVATAAAKTPPVRLRRACSAPSNLADLLVVPTVEEDGPEYSSAQNRQSRRRMRRTPPRKRGSLPSAGANQIWQANKDAKLLEYMDNEKRIAAGGSVRRGTRGAAPAAAAAAAPAPAPTAEVLPPVRLRRVFSAPSNLGHLMVMPTVEEEDELENSSEENSSEENTSEENSSEESSSEENSSGAGDATLGRRHSLDAGALNAGVTPPRFDTNSLRAVHNLEGVLRSTLFEVEDDCQLEAVDLGAGADVNDVEHLVRNGALYERRRSWMEPPTSSTHPSPRARKGESAWVVEGVAQEKPQKSKNAEAALYLRLMAYFGSVAREGASGKVDSDVTARGEKHHRVKGGRLRMWRVGSSVWWLTNHADAPGPGKLNRVGVVDVTTHVTKF